MTLWCLGVAAVLVATLLLEAVMVFAGVTLLRAGSVAGGAFVLAATAVGVVSAVAMVVRALDAPPRV
jgi:hypothetical protein